MGTTDAGSDSTKQARVEVVTAEGVRAWLQGNIAGAVAAAGGLQANAAAASPRPLQIKPQHSAFDRLADSGPGRR